MQLTPSVLVFVAGTFAYLGIRIAFKRKLATREKSVRRSTPADMFLVLLVGFAQIGVPLLAWWTPLFGYADHTWPAFFVWPGAATFLAGLWLFWRSHADLGSNWSMTLEIDHEHRLVTSGVYRWIRHPMYASFFVMAVAQALLLPNGIAAVAAFAAVSLLYLVRKPHEEAMMLAHFGAEYEAYMQRSGGVIPRLRNVSEG
jgi:protein-S-isoprenylcysteine O-methyltransferase Ste14